MPSTIWSGSRDDILPTLRRAFLIGASAVVAVAITVAWLYWANLKSSESVIQSQRIGRIARDSRALATDRESAVRSYLLSNGQLSLAPDAESATQLKAKIDSLISLTGDEPAQLERATDIRGAINRWERGWLTPALAGQSTSGIGITVAQDAAGTELFDSIRAAFDRFGAEQQRGFSKVVNGQVRLQKITLVAAAIEVMLLLAVLSWLSSTALAQAKRLIEQADQLQKQTADLGRHAKELEVETIQHRKLEDQLLQSQKMEAVGRLAGGVAHDFNNMLTAILSYGEMLLADLPDQSPQRADVTEIVKAAEKATALTRKLLAFSRQQVLRPSVVDLDGIIDGLANMVARLAGQHIEFKRTLAHDLWPVSADPAEIERVIMNLVLNARDAMPKGGILTIETQNVDIDQEYAGRHADTVPGPYVMISVTDNGSGMTKDVRDKVFEPFFTTKEGTGTGLGLASVYGIVKQSGGFIWVYSEPGNGTTFKVYLPRATEEAESADALQRKREVGGETILLVEDDVEVRRVTCRILRRNGYRVLEAGNGADAMKVCEQERWPIDLIMTDIVMPEMGGAELAKKIRQKQPDARFLFTSGYTEDAAVRQSLLDPGEHFIEKPFTPARLEKKAREILNSTNGRVA